jgi:hypothetical protein
VDAVAVFKTTDVGDVGMTQAGQDLGVAAELRKAVGTLRKRLGQNLQVTSRPSFVSRAR